MGLLYRLACPAILGAIAMALVACGAGPGATKTQDPVGFKNIELRQVSTREISLVNTFSGSELTYSATSSDTSKVKVAVDNDKDTFTVEAVSPGTATITITAKNSQGSASQTFTVTVPEPTDLVEIQDFTFGQEQPPHTIRLGDKFSGEDLTYTAASNNRSVATVAVDSDADTLTVTAVGPGTAIITVTAKNSQGPQTQTFTVTVPEPDVDDEGAQPTGSMTSTKCPPPAGTHLKIVRDEYAECTLQAGQRLISDDPASVSVKEPGKGGGKDVWIITAKKKGLHRVFIFDGNENVREILVKVPNTSPTWISDPDLGEITESIADTTTHKTPDFTLTDHFNDVDTPADRLSDTTTGKFDYTVSYAPEGVLINTEGGFVVFDNIDPDETTPPKGSFRLVILKSHTETTIRLHAHDGEHLSDNPVTLTFGAVSPRSLTYTAGQTEDKGDFTVEGEKKKLEVGNRVGVPHTINIAKVDTFSGFRFAEIKWNELSDKRHIPPATTSTIDHEVPACDPFNEPPSWATATPPTPDDLGTGCYSIRSSTGVEIKDFTAGQDPSVDFQLSSTHPATPTITITYHVWGLVRPKPESDGTFAAVVAADTGPRKIHIARKALNLVIQKCVSIDCP